MSKALDEKLKEVIIYFKQAPISAITIEQTISDIKEAALAEIWIPITAFKWDESEDEDYQVLIYSPSHTFHRNSPIDYVLASGLNDLIHELYDNWGEQIVTHFMIIKPPKP